MEREHCAFISTYCWVYNIIGSSTSFLLDFAAFILMSKSISNKVSNKCADIYMSEKIALKINELASNIVRIIANVKFEHLIEKIALILNRNFIISVSIRKIL